VTHGSTTTLTEETTFVVVRTIRRHHNASIGYRRLTAARSIRLSQEERTNGIIDRATLRAWVPWKYRRREDAEDESKSSGTKSRRTKRTTPLGPRLTNGISTAHYSTEQRLPDRTTAITGERTNRRNFDERKHETYKSRVESGRRKLVRFIALSFLGQTVRHSNTRAPPLHYTKRGAIT